MDNPNETGQPNFWRKIFLHNIFSRENVYALLLCLLLIVLIVVTADSAPQWIYQNF